MLLLTGMVRFLCGVLRSPLPIRLWLAVLGGANMVVPLLYLDRPEARAVLASMLLALTLMAALTARFGFTRILGVGHYVWFALLPYLVLRLGEVPAVGVYGVWIRAVIVLNVISLLFDIVDTVRYARGERAALVPELEGRNGYRV